MAGMHFNDDQIARMLASLPDLEPDPQCTGRIRKRCHAVLSRQRDRRSFRMGTRSWRLVFGPAAVAVLCSVYLVEVLRHALAVYGF